MARPTRRNSALIRRFLLDQYPFRCPVQVFELPGLQGPQECRQAQQAKKQGGKHQIDKDAHGLIHFSRRALTVTSREDDDMATAASSGVTIPAMASGTAATL